MTEYKCPHCGNTIEYVSYEQPATEYGTANLGENDGYFDHDEDSTDSDGDYTYKCPSCFEHLGTDYGEVMENLEEIVEEEQQEEEEPVKEEEPPQETNLKVGDKVIIRSNLEVKDYAEMNGLHINDTMVGMGGKECTISLIEGNYINLEEVGYHWHEKCFTKTKEQTYQNELFGVMIMSGKLIIQDKEDNILEYSLSKVEELKEILKKEEVLSISDEADEIKLENNHKKLLELLEKCQI